MMASLRRPRWPAGFWNVAGPVFIVLAMFHQSAQPPPSYIGSDNERAGFGVASTINGYNIGLLHGGWCRSRGSRDVGEGRAVGLAYLDAHRRAEV